MKPTISKYLFLLLFLSVVGVLAQPTLSLDWIEKEPVSYGKFIRHDNQKNIITVGQAGTNLLGTYVKLYISKLDTAGNVLWKRNLSDNGGGLLRATDMLIDSADNIYVTGRAHYNSQYAEGFLLKYDKQGNLQWRNYYGTNEGLVGEFSQMTIYNNSDIYVVGEMDSISGSGVRKALLVKYNSSGNFSWSNSDSLNYNREGMCAEVDKKGNPYLIGFTSCCLPGGKMFVEKYDSSGIKLWETVIMDTSYQYGYPFASTIDDSSFIYIAGEIEGLNLTTSFDCGIVKVDSSGNINWFQSFISSPGSPVWENARDIFVDKSYNCYVYGTVVNNNIGQEDPGYIFQLKKNGSYGWVKIGNGVNNSLHYSIRRAQLINDSAIVLSGQGYNDLQPLLGGIIAIEIDTTGAIIWNSIYPHKNDIGDIVYLDSSIYCTGTIQDTNYVVDDSLFTLKINLSQVYNSSQNGSFNKCNVSIFPNPLSIELNIKIADCPIKPEKIAIYNCLGTEVFFSPTMGSEMKINMSTYPKGVYLLKITNDKSFIYRKIVKQ